MKDSDYKKWGKVREMGRLRFVLLHGVFKFGIAMTVLMVVISKSSVDGWVTPRMLLVAVIGLILGLLFGVFVWSANESLYQRKNRIREDT